MQSTRRQLDLRPLEVAQLGSPETVAVAGSGSWLRPDGPSGFPSGRQLSAARLRARLDTPEFELGNLQLLVPTGRPSVFPRYFPCAEGRLANYQFLFPQCQITKRKSAAACRYVIRQSPNPIIAPNAPNPLCANRPRRAIHRRSLAFRQRPLFDQHYTRPAPCAQLHAVRLRHDEKTSSGLAL